MEESLWLHYRKTKNNVSNWIKNLLMILCTQTCCDAVTCDRFHQREQRKGKKSHCECVCVSKGHELTICTYSCMLAESSPDCQPCPRPLKRDTEVDRYFKNKGAARLHRGQTHSWLVRRSHNKQLIGPLLLSKIKNPGSLLATAWAKHRIPLCAKKRY